MIKFNICDLSFDGKRKVVRKGIKKSERVYEVEGMKCQKAKKNKAYDDK